MSKILLVIVLILLKVAPALAGSDTWREFYKTHKDFVIDYKYSTGDLLAVGSGSNKLPSGTPVVIRMLSSVSSSDAVVGTTVDFKVEQDVMVGDAAVIKAGTMGSAEVISAEDNGFIGEEGKLTVGNFEVKTANGTSIPLKGVISDKGESKATLSILLGVIVCLPFLFLKGKDATIDGNIVRTVYTAADYSF